MTREKIISLAQDCGFVSLDIPIIADKAVPMFEAFYHKAQAEAFEAAAVKCEQMEVRFDTRVWMYSTKEELSCITAKTIGNAIREMAKGKQNEQ